MGRTWGRIRACRRVGIDLLRTYLLNLKVSVYLEGDMGTLPMVGRGERERVGFGDLVWAFGSVIGIYLVQSQVLF